MSNSCIVSLGVIARIFPKTIVCTSTEVGDIDIIKSPIPKNELKIKE